MGIVLICCSRQACPVFSRWLTPLLPYYSRSHSEHPFRVFLSIVRVRNSVIFYQQELCYFEYICFSGRNNA